MTKIILIANEKGGVGKTTLSDELLFSLERDGYSCCFVNLDTQGGALHQPSIPDDSYDYVVIDTPGTLTKEFSKWCASSDMVLFPTRPSHRDMPPLMRCWDLAASSGCKHLAVVINDAKSGTTLAREFGEFVESSAMTCAAVIPSSQAFDNAAARRCSVYDIDKHSKATLAIEGLKDYVVRELEDGRE